MFECSVCSFVGFIYTCGYNFVVKTLEHPLALFFLSITIASVMLFNVVSANLICDVGNAAVRRLTGLNHPCAANCGLQPSDDTENFDYSAERGPHTWRSPNENQSPINIREECTRKYPMRELLTWNHYDDLPLGVLLENNGRTVIVRAAYAGNVPTLSGADLIAGYTFVELCFRWSLYSGEGSEHMINYRKYPLEVQALHRTGQNAKCTSSYDILIVSYFYDFSIDNPFLEPIIQNLHRIRKPGTKVEIAPFPLSYICYQFRTNFYSYGGSLTEPPCYQGAEWFIYPEALAISERQLHEFQQLLSTDGKTFIINNSRPVQDMDDSRTVNFNQYTPLPGCESSDEHS